MPQIPDLLTMLKSGVHFGHKTSKRHPKMKPFIFIEKNGFHIVNLEETQVKLKEALAFVTKVVNNGGTILFLGTKKQARKIVKEAAIDCQMPFITERWLGGTFTNFAAVSNLTKKFRKLSEQKEKGELNKYTKKERLEIDREIERLDKIVGGIAEMRKVPDAMFVVDAKKENTAVKEAIKKNIPVVALCDTNTNPDELTYPIPANDDAVKSIEMISKLVAEAVKEGAKTRDQKA